MSSKSAGRAIGTAEDSAAVRNFHRCANRLSQPFAAAREVWSLLRGPLGVVHAFNLRSARAGDHGFRWSRGGRAVATYHGGIPRDAGIDAHPPAGRAALRPGAFPL